jgi:hypothetical protein
VTRRYVICLTNKKNKVRLINNNKNGIINEVLHLKKLDPSWCLIDPGLTWIYAG